MFCFKKKNETFSATSPLQAWNSLCRADWAQSPGDPPASALWMLGLKRAAISNPDVYCDHGSVYGMEFKFLFCFHTGLHLPIKLRMTLDIWHSPASTSEQLDYQHVYHHAWTVCALLGIKPWASQVQGKLSIELHPQPWIMILICIFLGASDNEYAYLFIWISATYTSSREKHLFSFLFYFPFFLSLYCSCYLFVF